jgi:6-phosphofructokinase 1
MEPYGIYRGYQGLIDGDIKPLDSRSVGGIIHRGGTMLKSTRCEEIRDQPGLRKAYEQLAERNIEWLVIIGGDGSFRAGASLAKMGTKIIGIPASIDNDIYGTDETIGFDTAMDVSIDAIDKIRDTSNSFERIFLIEIMGRKRGFLTIAVGLASGAEQAIIPEIGFEPDKLCREILEDRARGKNSAIVVFAEGAGDVYEAADMIQEKTGIPTRASSLGYIQRGGRPSGKSRTLACYFALRAISLIENNTKDQLVVKDKNNISNISLEEAVKGKKEIDADAYHLIRKLSF